METVVTVFSNNPFLRIPKECGFKVFLVADCYVISEYNNNICIKYNILSFHIK